MNINKYCSNSHATHTKQPVDQNCPIEYTIELIGTKWSIGILRELLNGDRRTHELAEALPGISSKTLTLRLRTLEKHGIIRRKVYAEIPPHVEYSITEKGRELQPAIAILKQVGQRLLSQEDAFHPLKLNSEVQQRKEA
ncbi:MAG: helix-turn-helix transcriptional regulator [Limnoraphis sp. WC205]|jgi:DNA-binding HxlR family transcriptional regulator|nr:helix-turn-helix transcriptional regulator [Limnoraphis sp. WC205]